MNTNAPFPKGMRVIYIPTHAHGDSTHKDCQHGVVKKAGNPTLVLYDCAAVPHMTTGDEPYTAQATDVTDLIPEIWGDE
jgi:hypothetical protein